MIDRTRPGLDGGFTLIEILVSLAILGIAFAALLTGLATITSNSDTHRKGSQSGTLLRQWAESVEAAPLTTCSGAVTKYGFTTVVGSAAPSGYVPGTPVVTYWDGTKFGSNCTSGAEQQIVLNVKSSDNKDSQTLTLVKLQS